MSITYIFTTKENSQKASTNFYLSSHEDYKLKFYTEFAMFARP